MGSLENKKIKDSYKDLLQVSNENNGIDDTLRSISDGEGTESSLKLSSTTASFSGKVGIGTNDPSHPLHVVGSASDIAFFRGTQGFSDLLMSSPSNNEFHMTLGGSDDLVINTNSHNNALRIASGGNVGIGTTSPNTKLDVSGGDAGKFIFRAYNNTSTGHGAFIKGGGGPNQTRLLVEGSENTDNPFIIKGDGNVGIGTDAPVVKLDVSAEKSNSFISRIWNTSTELEASGLQVRCSGGADGHSFAVYSDDAYQFAIENNGNVGIGTTSPANNLVIRGSSDTDNYLSNDAPFMVIENSFNEYSKNNIFGGIGFTKTGASNVNGSFSSGIRAGIVAFYDQDHDFTNTQSAGNIGIGLSFRTSAQNAGDSQTRITITGSGNVGIGDSAPAQKLSVAGNVHISGDLTVDGEGTEIVTETLKVQDKTIIIADTTSPTEDTSNQAGIIVKGSPDKSFLYNKTSQSWNSSNNIKINDENVATESWVSNNAFSSLTDAQKAELKGDQGEPGADGAKGDSGVDGADGAKGDQGDSYFTQNGDDISYLDGNVGIGTDDPDAKFHVSGVNDTTFVGSAITSIVEGTNEYNSGDSGAGIGFVGRYDSAGRATTFAQIYSKKENNASGNYSASLRFATRKTGEGADSTLERMQISADGNVGIGTQSPEQKLHVKNGHLRVEDGQAWFSRTSTSAPLAAAQLGVGPAAVFTGGNVGIGTTSPGKPLHVKASSHHFVLEDSNAIAGEKMRGIFNSNNNLNLGRYTDDFDSFTTDLIINAIGDVGIGTTSPSASLHLKCTTQSDDGPSGQLEDKVGIHFSSYDSIANASIKHVREDKKDRLEFSCGINGFDFAQMSLNNDGNLGIGVSDPTAPLTIKEVGNTAIKILKSSEQTLFTIGEDGGGNTVLDSTYYDSSGNTSSKNLIIKGGNVGIGTTNPSKKLSVEGDAIITGDLTVSGTTITKNAETLLVKDKNIIMGSVDSSTPNDDTADGGGIIVKASTDKSILFKKSNNKFNVNIGATFTESVGIGTTSPEGSLEINSANGSWHNPHIHVKGSYPTIKFNDTSTDTVDWFLHVNNNDFYVLHDTDASGFDEPISADSNIWDSPNPLKIEGDSQKAFLYNKQIATTDDVSNASLFTQNGNDISYSDGNVGIGTTSPASAFHVKSSLDGPIFDSGDTDNANHALLVRDNANNQLLRVNNNGNVGIGTNSPATQLHIRSSDDTYAQLRVESSSGHDSTIACLQQGSIKYLAGYDDSTDTVGIYHGNFTNGKGINIDSTGNVGIGTNDPNAKLEILDGSNAVRINQNGESAITFESSSLADFHIAHDGISNKLHISHGSIVNNVKLLTVNANNGNVGIGTTSPSNFDTEANHLVIKGNNHTGMTICAGNDESRSNVYFADGSSGKQNYAGGITYDHKDDNLSLRAGSEEAMWISSDGKVGIGTDDPETQLHIKGAQPVIRLQDTNTNLYSEIYADTGDGDLLFVADSSAGGTNPFMSFRIGGGALANEKMRILSNGNVGIGTNDPAFKLDVKGDIASGILTRIENDNTDSSKSTTLLVRNNSSANDSTILGLHNDSDYVLQVKNNGNVAIGHGLYDATAKISTKVDSPDGEYFLDVKGTTDRQWGFYYDQGGWGTSRFSIDEFKADKTAHGRLVIANGGNVGIGDGNPSKKLSVAGDAIITGDLTVSGTTISVNRTELEVADKNIFLAKTAIPSDNTASGGGIIVKASTDKSILWNKSTNKFDVNIGATFSGLVGIGTTNPGSSLHVAGLIGTQPLGNGVHMGTRATGGNRGIIQLNGEGGGYIDFSVSGTDWKGRILYDNPNNYMRFDTNGQQRLRIDSDGNVGIGTTDPSVKLDVFGDVKVANQSKFYVGDSFNYIGSNELSDLLISSNRDIKFSSWRNGEEFQNLTILENSNVGIGTTNPSAKLHLNLGLTSTNTASGLLIDATSGSVNSATLDVSVRHTTDGKQFASLDVYDSEQSIGAPKSLVFQPSGGNVGIGTDDPKRLLHLKNNNSAIAFETPIDYNGSAFAQIKSGRDGNSGYSSTLEFATTESTTAVPTFGSNGTGGSGFVTRMLIDSKGNVGIGTTSPAYTNALFGGSQKTFHLTGTAAPQLRIQSSTSGQADLLLQAGNSSSIAYIANVASGGDLFFSTNNGGSQDTRLAIKDDGKVGIGTTSPVSKLHIENGDFRIEKDTKATIGFKGHTSDSTSTALAFRDSNAGIDRMIIDANGNVGIGTNEPFRNLTVAGNFRIEKTAVDDGHIGLDFNVGGGADHPELNIYDKDGNAGVFTIKNQNVGIGTTSPSAKLHVESDVITGDLLQIKVSPTTNGNPAGLHITNTNANFAENAAYLKITDQAGNHKFRVNKNGNVGIGTDDPDAELDVIGEISSGHNIGANSEYKCFSIRSTRSTNDYGGLGKDYWGMKLVTPGSDTTGTSNDHRIGNLVFQGANSKSSSSMLDVMTLTSDGNVGIGNSSPGTYKLNVTGNTYVHGHVSSNGTILTSDDRIKHNEQPIENALTTLSKITPKKYIKTTNLYEANHDFELNVENKPIDENGKEIEHTIEAGVIAQELKKIDELAFAVNDEVKDENGNVVGPHGVNYNSLFTYAIAAIQEQQTQIESLESKMKEYETILNIVKEFPPIKGKLAKLKK